MRAAITFLAALVASSAAQALEMPPLPDFIGGPGEWVLRGPAASKHFGLDYAPPVGQWSGYTECKWSYGLECAPNYTKQTVEYKFNEKNTSIGIEKRIATAPGIVDKLFFNVVEDSFSEFGVMAGVGRDFEIAYFSGLRIGAGVAGGLWNRTMNRGNKRGDEITLCDKNGGNCTKWGGIYNIIPDIKRKTIIYALPFFSVEHKDSGIGAEIAIAPKMKNSFMHVPETTVMIQMTFNLSKIF